MIRTIFINTRQVQQYRLVLCTWHSGRQHGRRPATLTLPADKPHQRQQRQLLESSQNTFLRPSGYPTSSEAPLTKKVRKFALFLSTTSTPPFAKGTKPLHDSPSVAHLSSGAGAVAPRTALHPPARMIPCSAISHRWLFSEKTETQSWRGERSARAANRECIQPRRLRKRGQQHGMYIAASDQVLLLLGVQPRLLKMQHLVARYVQSTQSISVWRGKCKGD